MTITLYALVMTFGAIVAAIGLVLLFRKQEQQSLSKIKIFGQELQFSAPGLVVTLAGCVLVVLLPVLGVKNDPVLGWGSGNVTLNIVNDAAKGEHHSFDTAYTIKLGSSTKGTITPQNRDFFKVQIPAALSGLPKVRVIAEKGIFLVVTAYDNNEQRVYSGAAGGGDPVSFSFEATAGAYYYIVAESDSRGEYLLKVKQE